MADFSIAYKRTKIFEGGYVNDPQDAGGETYKGVSRRANPNWQGWGIIDAAKKEQNFPKNLNGNSALELLVENLYRSNYWNAVWGDKITNQTVANDMFDTAVNMGVSRSIKLAQKQFKMPETGTINNELLTKLNSVL